MRGALSPVWISQRSLRRALSDRISRYLPESGGTWLDIGCGDRPYEELFWGRHYVGLDVSDSGRPAHLKVPDVLYDGSRFPICSNTADGILCTQVLEHVRSPGGLVAEMARVLRPGGIAIVSAPFVFEEHETPYDFTRFTRYGLVQLFSERGFVLTEVSNTCGAIETLGQLASVHLSQTLRLPFKGGGRIINALICAPLQLAAVGLQKLIPDAGRLYLDNVIVVRKAGGK